MIYGLSKLLRGSNRFFGMSVNNIHIFIIIMAFLGITKRIPLTIPTFVFVIIVGIIYTRILNKPYLYLWNLFNICLTKKFLYNRIYVFTIWEKIMFSKDRGRGLYMDKVTGIILNNKLYIDEGQERHLKILGRNYDLHIIEDLNFFLTHLNKKDTKETIKKKLILHNL